ncbi:MAG: adenosylcobinamide hydrolase [Natrialbaceae archaeon]|jgi:adenosylcobinamide hydrolase
MSESPHTEPTTDAQPTEPTLFEPTTEDDVLRLRRPGTRWLSGGWNGGKYEGSAAYSVSVPEGWSCENVEGYVDDRLETAGFGEPGPTLITGVDHEHVRGARCGPVEAYATAGVSNPAALPMAPEGEPDPDGEDLPEGELVAGTVNVVVGTTRSLAPGALANLLSVAAEAKTATLLARTGFPGTTSDAVIAADDPDGEPADFSGSAMRVGAAARVCVRDAVYAALESRYENDSEAAVPTSVEDASYGVSTDVRAEILTL